MDAPSPRHAAAHVLVASLDVPELGPDDAHHLRRVLRLRDGEVVTVTDGRGGWRPCVLRGEGIEPTGEVRHDAAPHPPITVAFVPPKGDRPELVVQKLTEIGVDRIVPVRSERAVVRWDDQRAAKHVARLRRVVHEAVMQSRRTWLPVVEDVVAFTDVVVDAAACLAEPGGPPPTIDRPLVLVGPEGGWSPAELAAASAAGTPAVGLGPHVLRAETAAIVAGALLVAARTAVRG